jgi:hypothetical protein
MICFWQEILLLRASGEEYHSNLVIWSPCFSMPVNLYRYVSHCLYNWNGGSRDHMVFGFTTTCTISAYYY